MSLPKTARTPKDHGANGLTPRDSHDAATTNLRAESSTWDALGRLKTVTNALGTHTLAYSTLLSRPDTLTRPDSLTTTFAYTANNAPGDSARRLSGITHLRAGTQQARHLYTYDKAGRIASWERQTLGQPAKRATYAYNLGDELVESEDRFLTTNTLLDRETWGLDDGGNWLSHNRSATNLMETRSIDVMNRLTRTGGAGSTVVEGHVNEMSEVTVNGEPAQMRADPVAGGYRFRRSVPVTEGANTLTVTAADTGNPPETTTKSWTLDVPGPTRTFTYDANGNTLSDGERTFTWDAKNRLRTVTKHGTTWKWDYDYRDRRVREYANNVLTKQYVWSGTEILQERNAANAVTRTHCFGGFVDGASPTTGTKYHTLTDHLGHVREVLTPTGTVAARYDYTPYQGPVKIGTSTVEPTFLTIGRYQHHAGTGLELALYRAYDPELGRWLSEDPIGEAGGLNLYGYGPNAPVSGFDPLGAAWYDTVIELDRSYRDSGTYDVHRAAWGGLAAWADGFIPDSPTGHFDSYTNPLSGHYSSCDPSFGISRNLGNINRDLLTVLGTRGLGRALIGKQPGILGGLKEMLAGSGAVGTLVIQYTPPPAVAITFQTASLIATVASKIDGIRNTLDLSENVGELWNGRSQCR